MQKYVKQLIFVVVFSQSGNVFADTLDSRVAKLEHQINTRSELNMASQIEQLQTEVQTLRGSLEVAEHSIAAIRQQQKDYYEDLNFRVNQLSSAAPGASAKPSALVTPSTSLQTTPSTPIQSEAAPNSTAVPNTTALSAPAMTPTAALPEVTASTSTTAMSATPVVQATLPTAATATAAEESAYQAAYKFLQNKEYDSAIASFNQYVTAHPNGFYAANAYYWLGETYFLQNKLPEAELAFKKVVDQYAVHQKAGDALLKLGYVYESQGDKVKAKTTFSQVVTRYPNTATAKLAEGKLVALQQNS